MGPTACEGARTEESILSRGESPAEPSVGPKDLEGLVTGGGFGSGSTAGRPGRRSAGADSSLSCESTIGKR